MRLTASTSASLVLLATSCATVLGCSVHDQNTCDGASCTGGSAAMGGGVATGGATPIAGTSALGGSGAIGSTATTGGTQPIGGSSSTSTSSVRTGGTSATSSSSGGTSSIGSTKQTGGASSVGGTKQTGGASSVGGTKQTGGASSVGGTKQTGGASSVGGTKQTGGASSVGGSAAIGGNSATGGTMGGTDLCPSDPNKTAPGTCGCGVADTDTDTDGVPDCSDVCPETASISKAGTITFEVVFGTGAQQATYAQYLNGLKSNMIAAGNEWAKHFPIPYDVTITVQIDIIDIPTANGKSGASAYSETIGSMRLYQQGATYEILTGIDPNDAEPDIEINFGIDPITGVDGYYYWSDPDPTTRTATMPDKVVDTYSTCLHELGHCFGFNGWRDWSTGELPDPGNYESYYDYLSSTDGTDFFFDGTRAVATYGSHVPETRTNISHIGNFSGAPGSDLGTDLMRGTETLLNHRYKITNVDLAILADIGLPLPGTPAARTVCEKAATGEPPVVELGPRPIAIE